MLWLLALASLFPIGFTKGPPPDGRTPSGADAYRELARFGGVFQRCSVPPHKWPAMEAELERLLDRGAETGFRCAIYIADLTAPANPATERELRRVVMKYRNHPGLAYWKANDEPDWGKVPVARVQRFYDIVHELDPRHPVWLTQAPRGTIESMKRYDPACDIAAIDIYPVGYPPGMHSHLPNKQLSVVGDYAAWLRQITGGRKPFWMVLQIAWSGVVKPGKTLRFPTFPQERYMTYQSIINGARGLAYFGGDLAVALNARDRELGWNWTFYDRVLRPVLDELQTIKPALLAPDSPAKVQVEGAPDVEVLAREAGGFLYVMAAKREGATVEARFSGLPVSGAGEVLFEDPRRVQVENGAFRDWFGPNEVHVYRFRR